VPVLEADQVRRLRSWLSSDVFSGKNVNAELDRLTIINRGDSSSLRQRSWSVPERESNFDKECGVDPIVELQPHSQKDLKEYCVERGLGRGGE
jgi:hypothetical protein